jgi:hypothetical protein
MARLLIGAQVVVRAANISLEEFTARVLAEFGNENDGSVVAALTAFVVANRASPLACPKNPEDKSGA